MKTLKLALFAIGAVILLLLVWGVLIEPRLIDEKYEVATVPALASAWKGKKVALIADFQVGMWLGNTDTVRRIVTRLVQLRPAAVLIAGDFVYKPTGEEEKDDVRGEFDREERRETLATIEAAVELVRPLKTAGIPVYAVLGNHDYAMMTLDDVKLEWVARRLTESLEAADIPVLNNEALPISATGRRTAPTDAVGALLYVVGIGSHFANNDHPARALAQVPPNAARIALMHNPDSFAKFPAGSAPLALSGHTHGGQIRIPGLPDWSWLALVSRDRVAGDGWIDGFGQPGNRLYVSRGIGFSLVPIRINCRPELTVFTLR